MLRKRGRSLSPYAVPVFPGETVCYPWTIHGTVTLDLPGITEIKLRRQRVTFRALDSHALDSIPADVAVLEEIVLLLADSIRTGLRRRTHGVTQHRNLSA